MAAQIREYTLSPRMSVAIEYRVPGPTYWKPDIEVHYTYVDDRSHWRHWEDLEPRELVKLADIVGMVNDWRSGKLAELLPSTGTRFQEYRARIAKGEE